MYHGSRIGSATLTDRAAEILVPGPADQWDPAIGENRLCWLDIRDGCCDVYTQHGTQVYCAELPTGVPFRVSDGDPDGIMGTLTLHGDFAAWVEVPPTPEGSHPQGRLVAYHWPSAARRTVVADGEPWPFDTAPPNHPGAGWPQVWDGYVYFRASTGDLLSELFRCDLRVFFADVLGGGSP
jgi:hypothetical protein